MTQLAFRVVRKGYDTTEVDQALVDLETELERFKQELRQAQEENAAQNVQNSKLAQTIEDLTGRVQMLEQTLAEERADRQTAIEPSFANLGERIGQMLTLAQEEAIEIRQQASQAAEQLRNEAKAAATSTIEDANRQAEDTAAQAEAEAQKVLAEANRQAESLREMSENEATARKEEAEAIYESQRAQAAAAAADFEQTLATRRNQAMAELTADVEKLAEQLANAEQQLADSKAEALEVTKKAKAEAEQITSQARSEADAMVAEAKTRAEGIRQNSERELAAATARRDSITAQLANVRHMLTTLSGTTASSADPLQPATAQDWAKDAEPTDEPAED